MDNVLYGRVRFLLTVVLAISAATLAVAGSVGGNDAVWTRGVIATAIAAVLLVLARRASQGSRAAYVRMRWMSGAAPVAIAVIVALPHDGFPVWMKVEQAVIGLLLLAVAIMVSRRSVRQAFAKTGG